MKKFKAEVFSAQESMNTRMEYYARIIIDNYTQIPIEPKMSFSFKSKSSAKRAANRVADKLGIELTWIK